MDEFNDEYYESINEAAAQNQIENDQVEFLKGNLSPINEGITEKEVTSWDL